MQFQATVFQNENQTAGGKTFGVLIVEQKTTIICDKCNFSLTGMKDEISESDFLILEDLTLCGECRF